MPRRLRQVVVRVVAFACLVAVLLAGMAVLPRTAHAAQAGSGFDFVRIESVSANFFGTDPTGCIQTDVVVISSEKLQRNPPAEPQVGRDISMTIGSVDSCRSRDLLFAIGSATPTIFHMSPDLRTATVIAPSVILFDEIKLVSVFLSVHLTWTAVGPIHRQVTHGMGFTLKLFTRSARASGSIVGPDTASFGVFNFASLPLTTASMERDICTSQSHAC